MPPLSATADREIINNMFPPEHNINLINSTHAPPSTQAHGGPSQVGPAVTLAFFEGGGSLPPTPVDPPPLMILLIPLGLVILLLVYFVVAIVWVVLAVLLFCWCSCFW